jgi:hypothetical protein
MHPYFHENLAHDLHEARLREARQERLAAIARGASPDAMRRVRGRRIAALVARRVPRLRQRAAWRGV